MTLEEVDKAPDEKIMLVMLRMMCSCDGMGASIMGCLKEPSLRDVHELAEGMLQCVDDEGILQLSSEEKMEYLVYLEHMQACIDTWEGINAKGTVR